MKISGFTIVRNALKFNYPVLESIQSILPICDEFIINVGHSDDETLSLVKKLNQPKIRIIETTWDLDQKPDVLSYQTNLTLKECKGDWTFYLQSDEVIHEADLEKLKGMMAQNLNDESVDALMFKWLHFYGSYFRYRIDQGWFQKQVRIIRSNGTMESCKDAWTFQRCDGQPVKIKKTNILLYHYGWVQPSDVMAQRRSNAEVLWNQELSDKERKDSYDYGDLNRFQPYFGSHPNVMKSRIQAHGLSKDDLQQINQKYWWHPFKILKARIKTGKRIRQRIK